MNNYNVIHTIDGILERLWAVSPSYENRANGPTQWLFLCETKDSFESELSRAATVLSPPSFPASEPFNKKKGVWIISDPDTGDSVETTVEPPPRLVSGAPLPKPKGSQVAYSADFHLVQSLSGLRAVLLVLLDSCSLCAADPDYVGHLPYTDSLSVLTSMKTWSVEDFVPNAKYWKDWPLARFLRNPFPKRPDSWHHSPTSSLFSGETGEYFRRLATYDDTRPDAGNFYRAVFGISQSKRGFAEVPRSFVNGSFRKHRAQLSTPPTLPR